MEKKHNFTEAPLGFKFKLIHDEMIRRRNEEMKADDLTFSQAAVLFFLFRKQEEKISQKELCEAMQVTHPTMIGLLSRMEEKGLITTGTDPENHRRKLIRITRKGADLVERQHSRHEAGDRVLVQGFTPEEETEFNRLLALVYDNIRKENEKTAD